MLKKLVGHTAVYGLAPRIPQLASLFILPLIMPYLSDVDFGVFGLITAYVGGFRLLSSFGLNVTLANAFYKSRSQYRWKWKQILAVQHLGNLILQPLIVAPVIYLSCPAEARENVWTIVVLNITAPILFGNLANVTAMHYQLSQKPFPIAIRVGSLGLLSVGLNYYFIAEMRMGYMGWFWSGFIVGMLTNISYLYPFFRTLRLTPIYRFRWRYIKKDLKVGLPTIPHQYSNYLLNISDRVVMQQLGVSTSRLGRYNLAASFGTYFDSFSDALTRVTGPLQMKSYAAGKFLEARELIFTAQTGFFLLTFTFSFWAKEIFEVLIDNESLKTVYPLAIVIVMSYNYRPMYSGAASMYFFSENTKLLWRISFIAGMGNLLLNFALIPVFGYETAAYTTFLGFMWMGYSGYFYKAFKERQRLNYYPLRWLLATVLLTVLAYIGVEWGLELKITAYIGFLLGIAFMFYLIQVRKIFSDE